MRYLLIVVSLILSFHVKAQVRGGYSKQVQERARSQTYYNFLNDRNVSSSDRKLGFLNDSTLEIQTRLLINVPAEAYVAILSLRQTGKTAITCNQTAEQRIKTFSNSLIEQGIVEKTDIYIDFIAQVPTYSYEIEKKIFSKNANEVPTGFELTKNIHISFSDIQKLDQIMLKAAEVEIYELVKVDYVVAQNTLNSVYDSLRREAIVLTQEKLEGFEKLGVGFSGDHIRYKILKENLASTYPVERYESYSAYRSAQLPQGEFKTTTRAGKAQTYFYDKLPYNTYDRVLNPEIVEPAVQFSYELKMRYVLNRK